MSMLQHRDEFLPLYSKGGEFKPSTSSKETDVLGFVYANKPDKLEGETKNDKI